MLPHVRVVATGGTIASTPGEDGAAPSLDGSDLLEAVPDLDSHVELSAESVSQVPGFDVDFEVMAAVADRARAAAEAEADAVVVTHGTDTMAETAYFLDLTCSLPVPVVLAGAQRRLDEPSSDAPANLLAAVRAATHPRVDSGVFLAFDDQLHPARDVRKVDTHRLAAFASPNDGPVATLTRDEIRFHREPTSESVSIPNTGESGSVEAPDARVELVLSAAGVDGAQVARAVDAGADGVVVAGTGLGNATSELGEAVVDAIDADVPVVLTSRCARGATGAVYGTPGGGKTLRDAGAIPGGDLPAWKARVRLALALAAAENATGSDRTVDEVRRYFDDG
ncbi:MULTISPECIES: asparaginase [Halorussus]|uniref:asparaginase n=1 Tax=Halorussus TaxID=1070314 RepID=UPI000E211416|nr:MULTISPECIES: asparaginase [Halorussus]NHN58718.1 asparaginase [Halorussus sp. JP-T4]